MVRKLTTLVAAVLDLLTVLAVPLALAQSDEDVSESPSSGQVPSITGEQQGDPEQIRPGTELPVVAPRESAPKATDTTTGSESKTEGAQAEAKAAKAKAVKSKGKKELPKTGGNGRVALLVLGTAGVLLVGGGLLAFEISRKARD